MVLHGGQPLVELRGITKVFPGVIANDSVDLKLHAGEIHCLLGENGAGKSTLMQVLSGMCTPDSGNISVDGAEVEIGSPRVALDLGIGMVYQHNTLIPGFTVLENLMLRNDGGLRLDRSKTASVLRGIAVRLGVEIEPAAVVGDLALGRQQQVEIVKVLALGSRVLVLDEPTAMLAPREVAELQKVLASLKAEGLAVVFITHKLGEALAVADRITVLRRGRVAGRLDPGDLQARDSADVRAQVLSLMFGEEARELLPGSEIARVAGADRGARPTRVLSDVVVLEMQGLACRPARREVGFREITFDVHRGEIVGIAGVDGNGQQELAEAIAGQRSIAGGRLVFMGRDVTHASVAERQGMGLRFVTDDRLGEGSVSSLPISVNLLLKRIGRKPYWGKAGRMATDHVCEAAQRLVEEYDIRTPDIDAQCGTLSGGNLQKMLLARELSFDPVLVVFNKPTYGLDAKTSAFIRERMRRLSEREGVAAVLISTDLEELADLCDRIGVMFRGRMVGVVENNGVRVEERVGALMVGESL